MTERREDRDFVSKLKELDRQLASVDLPAGSEDRLRQRIRKSRSRTRPATWLAAGLATAAVAVAAFFLLVYLNAEPPVAGFSIVGKSEGFRLGESREEALVVARGQAVLEVEELAVRLDVEAGSSVKREERAVWVMRGRVRVQVKPRPKTGPPVMVRVSHGTIEVLGTSFTVVQREEGGQVTLHAGRIRFVALSGEVIHLLPSETIHWPLPAPVKEADVVTPPEPSEAIPAPVPGKTRMARPVTQEPEPAELDLATFLNRLERLRVRRRFGELTALIQRELPRIKDAKLKESLSYELGDLLVHRLGDSRQACLHWRQHLSQFPDGRYTEAVRRSQRLLQCGSLPP